MNNVLILMSDEHNPLYSSVYHHPFVKTPNLEKLATKGTLFKNAYCPSPLCMPSRSAFISGKRVHEIQTYNNCQINLDRSIESYGDYLNQQGVHTVHIGKTHFYDQGKNLGFSEMILPRESAYPGNIYIKRNPLPVCNEVLGRASGYGTFEQDRQLLKDLDSIEAALGWLQTKGTQLEQPWVMAVNVVKPHFPHNTTQKWWDAYEDYEDLPQHLQDFESAQHAYASAHRKYFQVDTFTEAQVRGLRRGYFGCISFVDEQLGRLMEALESTGLEKTTNLVYISDHGEMLGKFGMWWKCCLYEDAIRIPCVASGPDFPSQYLVETPIDLHDVQASIFQAVGGQHPEEWLGEPLNQIPKNDPERVIFSEYHGHGAPGSSFMIRKGNWKYIHYTEAPQQLFDLEADPNELENLVESHLHIAQELSDELRKICDPAEEHQRAESFITSQLEKANTL